MAPHAGSRDPGPPQRQPPALPQARGRGVRHLRARRLHQPPRRRRDAAGTPPRRARGDVRRTTDARPRLGSPRLPSRFRVVRDRAHGISKLRNRVIGRVFHALGLIEQWGSGIQRMTAACREAGLAAPRFEEIAAVIGFRRRRLATRRNTGCGSRPAALLPQYAPALRPRAHRARGVRGARQRERAGTGAAPEHRAWGRQGAHAPLAVAPRRQRRKTATCGARPPGSERGGAPRSLRPASRVSPRTHARSRRSHCPRAAA